MWPERIFGWWCKSLDHARQLPCECKWCDAKRDAGAYSCRSSARQRRNWSGTRAGDTHYLMTKADLHCHTTHSDGTFEPEALIKRAKENNLTALAITDHDSISAHSLAKKVAGDLQLL